MSGGWASSDRKSRLPADWPTRRKAVLERCGGRCETVKKNGKRCWDKATQVDHVIPGDDHSFANLAGICDWCHARKSAREGNEAQAAARAILKHPVETHPGTIQGPPRPTLHKGF